MKIKADKKLFDLIKQEQKRQAETLMMIPSENYASKSVMNVVGSVLMNKYAEGQIGKRYYQGNKYIDQIEQLCKDRALKTFRLDPEKWGVNVQAHSGCPANLAVYNAILQPGDKIMAMSLLEGGHLSHGWHINDKKITLVSKIFNVTFYHVDKQTLVFNYDKIAKLAKKVKPKLIISGGTAYPREIDYKKMAKIAHTVGAYYLADVAHESGLIAAKVNSSPFKYADVVTMTTHKTLRGPRGALIFARSDLINQINRSVFPGIQGGPHEHSIAGIAVALTEAQSTEFRTYAKQVIKNAQTLATEFKKAGINVISGGTDKHLVLLDLRSCDIFAWGLAWALEHSGIITNFNTVPCDTASPFYPSGLRLGSPALTTRGMKEKEMKEIVSWIVEIINLCHRYGIPKDKTEIKKLKPFFKKEIKKNKKITEINKKVKKLCSKFPVE